MTDHSKCDHARTKSARAACRRAKAAAKPNSLVLDAAYAMNEMWSTLNTAQEMLLRKYAVIHTLCEYCDQNTTCFVFPHLGINVCGTCERMHDVHEYEEQYTDNTDDLYESLRHRLASGLLNEREISAYDSAVQNADDTSSEEHFERMSYKWFKIFNTTYNYWMDQA